MRTGRGLLLIMALSVALAAGRAVGAQWASAFGAPTKVPISLTIRAVQPVVRAGSPVIVELVTKNISDHGIPDYRGFGSLNTPGLAVEVHDQNGKTAPRTESGKSARGLAETVPIPTLVGGPKFKPGAVWEDMLYIDDEYDMSKPGEYTIRIGQRITSSMVAQSNTITVRVEDAAQYNQQFGHRAAPFLLTITIPENTVKAGSDIPLRVYTTNVSDHDVKFDATKLQIRVLNAQGNSAPWIGGPEARRILDKGLDRQVALGAFVTFGNSVFAHLNKLYDLTKPGRYTIQVSRFDDQNKTWVKSNVITLTVTP